MRHQIKVRKLGRPRSHREAMLANMVRSLFVNHSIRTTETKARELKKLTDRLISIAKTDTLAARRRVGRTIKDKIAVKKLFSDIVPQFQNRDSGFTRVMRVGFRRGDSATISIVELLTDKPKVEKEKGKKGKKTKK